MPRYLRVKDIPDILTELKAGDASSTPYQLDEWQKRWCHVTDTIEEDAAVLSYRWRIRGHSENIKDYRTWLKDCRSEGYQVAELRDGQRPVRWELADGHALQIEVAAWLLFLHTNSVAEYAWVDQMCVPQDASVDEKMGHIKDSPAIYAAGKVYVLLAPVVDYATGRIMTAKDARELVKSFRSEMNNYRGYDFLSRSAVKCLLVNHSYMRRVWTIQEAVAASRPRMWPLLGEGELNSYQSLYVVDWPEFNAWNGHPELGPIYTRLFDKDAEGEAVRDYYDGDYTGAIRVLREHASYAIGYLAMMAKDLMWITQDRNGFTNDIKRATSAARRAYVLLNHQQVHAARSFLPEDRVLALVPLVDYGAWKSATAGVPGHHLVQASVAWAYGVMEGEMQTWKWSMRVYNSTACSARGLELLQPRRNLGDTTSMHGASPRWEQALPPGGSALTLPLPQPHPTPKVASYLAASGALGPEAAAAAAADGAGGAALARCLRAGSGEGDGDDRSGRLLPAAVPVAGPLALHVELSVVMPHPGNPKYWGGGPWTGVRDALGTDEGFRLAVQWSLEPWRDPTKEFDIDRCAVYVVVSSSCGAEGGVGTEGGGTEGGGGGRLRHPCILVIAIPSGEKPPRSGQVMTVLEVARPLLQPLLDCLKRQALSHITEPLTALSGGVDEPAAAAAASAPSAAQAAAAKAKLHTAAAFTAAKAAVAMQGLAKEEQDQEEGKGAEGLSGSSIGSSSSGEDEEGKAAEMEVEVEAPAQEQEPAEEQEQEPAKEEEQAEEARAEEPGERTPAEGQKQVQATEEEDGAAAAANGLPFTGALEAAEEGAPANTTTAPVAAAATAQLLSDAPMAAVAPAAGTAIQKGPAAGGGGEGGEAALLPFSGVETAAGAKYAGQQPAPVKQEDAGCCCTIS
ncbi:hypothetical protein HYH02_013526 [Chlamydomonas schloesseri]|uniref:Heterokaryon incompatibility domain-containing protein n=1 Tax=Chlamydomonas schloesseri TaxID=2026947 RepID=A0A835VZ52_9CHLO|nr:hypothetical protein HYH02_013526 [Chlamydomonas schloesseri]|eukprot:KAG2430994.1 hypothetical protein HYH02_013526 [Chlamydomonas schloesseri]